MATMRRIRVGRESFEVDIAGLRDGDSVRGVGEQCEGCGSALDAGGVKHPDGGEDCGAYALLTAERTQIKCSGCGARYPLAKVGR